ncbi:MAG: DNA repair protein RecN [Ignavibacteriales bacterium]|nr:DNA repair protein RecN [Ignavibacteriales bacterium]
MLKSLYIKQYALIEDMQAEFESGLNILTGETGAGKSIIIDALSLILGERASTEVVRKGAEKAIIEGLFGVAGNKKLRSLLSEHTIEYQDELILRREVSTKGQNRCFANDSPIPLSVLKQIGELLVDLHGQHEHQSLLRPESHLELLDDFGGLDGLVKEYRSSYDKLASLFAEISDLMRREQELKEKRDLYEFQIKEIDAVNPQDDEERQLEAELKILENSEKLYQITSQLYQTLYEGENAVYDLLVKARNQLEDLTEIDKAFEEAKNECASASAVVDELTKFIQRYNSRIEFNPDRLDQIRERLGRLSLIKKKYGGSVEAIRKHRGKIGREFAIAQNFGNEIAALKEKIEEERKTCSSVAQRLSTKRRELVNKINESVVAELAKLGISRARFDVGIENRVLGKSNGEETSSQAYVKLGREFLEATPRGIDFVEFLLSTNMGEDIRPLAKVASGGEISRVMLALKTILAKFERLPLLVFDEIDVGVSGRIAQAVGKSLKNLSQFHQIIAITHLPQIAGLADVHFLVEKVQEGKRTSTRLRKLDVEERVEEVAKLMSGIEITEAGLAGARELMGLK